MRTVLVLALGLALVAACAKKDGEGAGTGAAADTGSPEGLGGSIAETQKAAVDKLAELVKDKPDAATVKPKIEALKQETITKMVELGKKREAMAEAERSKVDTATFDQLGKMDPAKMQALTDAANHYRASDPALANEIAGFNVLTQYAAYELLKQQKPDEAKRLGIQ